MTNPLGFSAEYIAEELKDATEALEWRSKNARRAPIEPDEADDIRRALRKSNLAIRAIASDVMDLFYILEGRFEETGNERFLDVAYAIKASVEELEYHPLLDQPYRAIVEAFETDQPTYTIETEYGVPTLVRHGRGPAQSQAQRPTLTQPLPLDAEPTLFADLMIGDATVNPIQNRRTPNDPK